MLYSQYTKRMTRLAAFLKTVRRFRIPIIITFLAIVAAIAALLGTRGIVYDSVECPTAIEYGSAFEYRAGAFMDDVRYEFRAEGESEWTETQPVRAGKYYVRAVSTRTFGGMSYGKVHAFSILPKPLDINVAATVVYGETPEISADTVYDDVISCTEFEYADLSRRSTQVHAKLDGVTITDALGNDVTSSYALRAVTSDIAFIAREIEITVESVSFVYDGQPHSSDAWELTAGTLAEGDMIVPVFDKTQTDAGEVENTPVINVEHRILSEDGIDVTANYAINKKAGTLTVQKRTVVIDTASAERVYDGSPFTCDDYTVDPDTPIVDGHRLEVASDVFRIDVGQRANTLGFKAYDGDGADVTQNYNFIVNEGVIEVTPRPLKIKTASGRKEYDGTRLSNGAYELTDGTTLVPGHGIQVLTAASIVDAGVTDNIMTVRVNAADGETDLTFNYEITYDPGTLTVTPRPITVTTYDQVAYVYDGNVKSTENITCEGLLTELGHGYSVTLITAQKDATLDENGEVISIANVAEIAITGTLETNYTINYEYGVMVIHPRPLYIDTPDHTWIYDGETHSDENWRKSQGGIYDAVDGESVAVVSNTQIKDVVKSEDGSVASVPNVLAFDIENGKLQNYKLYITVGELKIVPRPVVLRSNAERWVYDGDAHYCEQYTVVSSLGFVEDNAIEIATHTEITDVGVVENVLSHRFAQASADNYEISWLEGNNLEVYKRSVKIVTASDGSGENGQNEWVYDGDPRFNDGWNVAEDSEYGFAKDHSLDVVKYSTVTNVKRYDDVIGLVDGCDNVIEFKLVGAGIDDPTAEASNYSHMLENYDIEYVYGKLTILPRKVKIETASNGSGEDGQDRWEYDGRVHSDRRWNVAADSPYGFVKDHTFITSLYTQVTDVKRSGESGTPYYETEVVSYDNRIEFFLTGTGIDHASGGDGFPPSNYIEMRYNYDFLDCTYEGNVIVCATGKLTILPVEIDITTHSNGSGEDGQDRWIYDGERHDETGFTASRQPISGEIFAVGEFTSIESVGNKSNILKLSVLESDGTDKTHNYELTYTYGSLTMYHREVSVRIHSADKVYDDTPLSCTDYTVTSDIKFVEGQTVAAVNAPTITDVGETDNEFALKVIGFVYENQALADVTSNYKINYTYGKLRVDHRPITVKTGDKELVYNGAPQSVLLADISSNSPFGLAEGHTIVASAPYTTVTDVGSATNIFEVNIIKPPAARAWTAGEDKTANYTITYEYGTITVIRRNIKVKAASDTKMYDGTPLRADKAEFLDADDIDWFELVKGHTCEIACTGEQTDVGSCANLFVSENLIVKDASGKDVTSNYAITYIGDAGTLTVTKRTVSVSTDAATKVYDGDPLTKESFTVTSAINFVTGHRTVVIDAPSITDVGEIDNLFLIEVYDGERNVSFNYEISYDYGKLKIEPRQVTVVTNDNEWVYDGASHFDEGWQVSEDSLYGFVKDHTLRVDGHTEITNVSSVPNELTFTVINTNPDNYAITVVCGTLTVTPRHITVTTPEMEKVYDGTPLVSNGNSIVENLIRGHRVILKNNVSSSVTDVTDEGFNVAEIEYIYDNTTGTDVTDNYEVEYKLGRLVITPRPITVLTASNEWEYDGVAHYDDGFVITEGSLVEGQSAIVGHYPTITEPGEIPNELEIDIVIGNVYKTRNYLIRYDYGTLIVTEPPDIPDDPDDPNRDPFIRVKSDVNTVVYLRETSFGDYTGTVNWSAASEYARNKINYNGKNYSVNYLPNIVMQNSGFKPVNTQVQTLIPYYAVPYFPTFAESNAVQTSDVGYTGDEREYSFEHYNYMYATDNGAALGAKSLGIYANIESDYRAYVYANYLSVPESTAAFMQSVIAERRFDRSDAGVIKKVAGYVQTAAEYDKKYDRALDSSADVAVAFLRDYKKGICVHYATAATLLFRTLGLPARYTVGVMTPVKADEWTDVKEGHAWVEVYIDGAGWMPVEVTGGNGNGDGNGGGNGGGDAPDPDGMKEEITLKPKSVEALYDGNPHYAPQEVESADGKLEALTARGYSYVTEVSGSRTDVGYSESTIVRFSLYNEQGRNVTDDYILNFEPGIIRVVLSPIHISTFKLSRPYDGTPLKFEELIPGMGILLPTTLPEGVASVELDYEEYEGITEVGTVDCVKLAMIFETRGLVHITSVSGEDVTANYSIVFDEGSLTVTQRKITVATKNASKKYDGTPLEPEPPEVVKGSLAEGHSLQVLMMTSVTEITDRPVQCAFLCRVVDAEGNDVSEQYDISYVYGLLTVTP